MAKCLEEGSQCTIKDVPLYVYDKISQYEEECPQEYTEEIKCETRVRRDCDVKQSNGTIGCTDHTVHTVHDCYNSTRPTQRRTHREVCKIEWVKECRKIWGNRMYKYKHAMSWLVAKERLMKIAGQTLSQHPASKNLS